MTDIRRGTVVNAFTDALKLDLTTGAVPNAASEKLVLTYDYSNARACNIVTSNGVTASGAAMSLYTTPTTGDFYLTSVSLSIIKDALCDSASSTMGIQLFINGAALTVCRIAHHTLTAQSTTVTMSFPVPIKVDRNTGIAVVATPNFTAGFFDRSASIAGFLIDA